MKIVFINPTDLSKDQFWRSYFTIFKKIFGFQFFQKNNYFFPKKYIFFHFHNLQNRSSIKIREKKVASTWIWTRDPWLASPPLYLCANWDWCIWVGQIKYIKYNVSILMLFLQFFVVYWDLGNMNLEKKFQIFFYLSLRKGFLKKVSGLNWTK